MIKATLLGTSCMVPTKERNAPGIYAEVEGIGLLLDCGEGTQRQMNIADISRTKVNYILITHWHADHTAGILGLIQTIGSSKDNPTIDLYGPVGTKERMKNLMNSSVFENRVQITINEINAPKVKEIVSNNKLIIKAVNLYHSIPSVGYRIEEKDKRLINMDKLTKDGISQGPHLAILQSGKNVIYNGKEIKFKEYTKVKKGKSLTYLGDTQFTQNAILLSTNSDVLISESTYSKKHEKQAEERFHMTSEQAAQIASLSNSERLILTHFSQRYKTTEELLKEAKDIFPNTEIGYDFMKIKI